MKVSEAIRKGAEGRKQCSSQLFDYDQNGQLVAVCALGAAYVGQFGVPAMEDIYADEEQEQYSESPYEKLRAAFPEMREAVALPEALRESAFYHESSDLLRTIYLLNDTAGFSLSAVADYVEGLGY